MTSLDQRRRERAHSGSRRKRDLEATQPERPDWDAYIAQHFPDEGYGFVLTVTQRLWMTDPPRERTLPDPEQVRESMRARGWLREQREGESCL
jgi:hypothetical protein